MIFDWLAQEGWIIANWWLLATVAGATVLPLAFRLLPALPDQGYSLARPAGILLIAFVFWFLSVLGFLQNTAGGILLAWLVVLAVSALVFLNGGVFDWRDWWRRNRLAVIFVEVLFLALLLGWSTYRAHQNELRTTEKPMDLAFMSAAQRSPDFPPDDPWLSDYSVSYYYLGYVMGAMVSTMSGVDTPVGMNMHIALLFALVGTTSFGVAYNLIRSRAGPSQRTAVFFGVMGTVFVLWLSNFHTVLVEMPYRQNQLPEAYLEFWDAKDRDTYGDRVVSASLVDPGEPGFDTWWWFAASRVVTERDLNGNRVNEVIDEFPMFSFVLADSHPHVMALPFALLAIGLALNILLSPTRPDGLQTILYGVAIGSLVFLNTWDFPIYLVVAVGADAVRRLMQRGRLTLDDWLEMVVFGVTLIAITLAAYAPFLLGFRSQLQGLLPNILHPTRFQQLFVMFGPFFLILAVYLVVEVWRNQRLNLRFGFQVAGGVVLALVLVLALLMFGGRLSEVKWAQTQQFVADNGGWDTVVGEVLRRRLVRVLTLIVLAVGLALVVARLFPRRNLVEAIDDEAVTGSYPPATGFALLMIGAALGLILIPEFVYFGDNFGWRMNTVFKFYYQAWAMLALASTYAVYSVLADHKLSLPAMPLRFAFAGLVVLVVAAGSIYPVLAIYTRAWLETGRHYSGDSALTLDAGPGFVSLSDYQAIMCLADHVGQADVVVAEANPQGNRVNYNPAHGRVGALTGIPVILGWPGHQSQWRGSGYAAALGTRPTDLNLLYTASRMSDVQYIIDRYGIDYIIYGSTERTHYGSVGEDKFLEALDVVCESSNSQSRVYRVSGG